MPEIQNDALRAEDEHRSAVENAYDYIENFDILETITNVGNDEVFTPAKVCNEMLDSLPDEVWHNPNYKWLNPCTKNGIFEREIAIRLDKGLCEIIPDMEKRRKHILQNMIYAIGLTKFTSYVARRTLYYCSDATRKCDGILADDKHYVNGYAIGNGSWFDTPEGNIKTPDAVHKFGKDGKCVHCGVRNDSKYVDPLQREQYAYQFIHFNHPIELQYWLADTFFNGDKNMKFDIIIGNPPYQLGTGGGSAQATPIYNCFVDNAKKLNPKYLSMITPSKWFAGGMGLDKFRASMLNDTHIRKLVDYPNAKDCFPSASVGGGVSYFLWDREYSGECEVVNISNGKENRMIRKLNQYDVFVRYNEALEILKIVQSKHEKSFMDVCSSLCPFGIGSDIRGEESPFPESLTLYSSKGVGYVKKDIVTTGFDYIDKHKIMISKTGAEHANEPASDGTFKILSVLKVLCPNEICTFSYFLAGPFKSEIETNNAISYLKTRFARFLIMQSVSSINLSKDKFRFLPMQDFSKPWTDKELYEKYGLDKQEIDFIESMIRPME